MLFIVCLVFFLIDEFSAREFKASLDGCKTRIDWLPPLQDLHQEIRSRFVGLFRMKGDPRGIVFLKGGEVKMNYDTDTEISFKQESNFLYLTGVAYPDYSVAIDIETRMTYLFAPKRDTFWAVWNGVVKTLEELKAEYGVDGVIYATEYIEFLKHLSKNGEKTVYTLYPDVIPNFPQNSTVLKAIVHESRVVKTPSEIYYLEVAANVSSDAHITVMKDSRIGLYEYNYASYFKFYTENCGLLHQSYIPIVGFAEHSAILHYNVPIAHISQDGFLLIDAGGQFKGFSTDITRTFPVAGKFNENQKMVYEMVLNVVLKLEAQCAPGISWKYLHQQMGYLLTQELIKNDFINGDLDALYKLKLFSYFCPHSLGHSVGFDVHDPGVITNLEENMIITIEPGVYFNEVYLNIAMNDPNLTKHMNVNKIKSFLDNKFGGVRIEDIIQITKEGMKILSWVPKSVAEIENIMKK